MCGIAGIMRLGAPMPVDRVKRMCDAIAYRGPDDAGYVAIDSGSGSARAFTDSDVHRRSVPDPFAAREAAGAGHGDILLGHRRLSVLDLTIGGHQPMASADRQTWITYNGEIYNFADLRAELEAKGYHFFSRSDTEVLLRLYEDQGEKAFARLNGIFACAIWDGHRHRLVLARDRYGCKPLYVARTGEALLFGSEVKAMLASGFLDARLHLPSLVEYFTFQNLFGPETLFDGVQLLPPGHYLIADGDGVHLHQYWDWPDTPPAGSGWEVDRRELAEQLHRAVRRQMVADVPVGSYLSGGIDSASITYFASRQVPRLMSFTGGFDVRRAIGLEASFDERYEAEQVAAECGTEHYQMVIHAGDMAWALPPLTYHLEDLRVGMSYPNYYMARLASKFVKVVLSGCGGDELFAGYPWRYQPLLGLEGAAFDQAHFAYWCRLLSPEQYSRAFTAETLARAGFDPRARHRAVFGERQFADPLRRLLYFEAKTFLHGLLIVEDRLSMAHGLEARVPLLDNDLVDFVQTMPTSHLMDLQAAEVNLAGKKLFREAMRPYLPESIVDKRKQGFSPPDQTWYKGPLNDYVRAMLLSDRTLSRGLFRPEFIQDVLGEHFSGQANHRLLIWSLLSFEVWCRLFLDGERPEALQR